MNISFQQTYWCWDQDPLIPWRGIDRANQQLSKDARRWNRICPHNFSNDGGMRVRRVIPNTVVGAPIPFRRRLRISVNRFRVMHGFNRAEVICTRTAFPWRFRKTRVSEGFRSR